MNKEHIANLIKTLDEEIEHAEALSSHDVELLQDLRRDIEKLLERSPSHAAGESELVRRLRNATGRFEVTHPALTSVMAQVIDSLVKLGF